MVDLSIAMLVYQRVLYTIGPNLAPNRWRTRPHVERIGEGIQPRNFIQSIGKGLLSWGVTN